MLRERANTLWHFGQRCVRVWRGSASGIRQSPQRLGLLVYGVGITGSGQAPHLEPALASVPAHRRV